MITHDYQMAQVITAMQNVIDPPATRGKTHPDKHGIRHLKKLIENAQHRTLIELLRTEKKKIAAMHKITRSTIFNTVGQVLDTILEACMDCLNVEKGSVMIFKDGFST